jgi:ribA/ribD-fused uncharacterized protein
MRTTTNQKNITLHEHTNVLYFTNASDPYGWLDASFEYSIQYRNNTFNSVESLFQWLRFVDHQDIQSKILRMKRPRDARKTGLQNLNLLKRRAHADAHEPDIALMQKALKLLIEQHPYLKQKLSSTGDKVLLKSSMRTKDGAKRFWGAEFDEQSKFWVGANVMGRLWMGLREELQSAEPTNVSDNPSLTPTSDLVHDHDSILYFTGVKEPYGWLGNMYSNPIKYDGKTFRTPEALFQWIRFYDYPDVQNEIFAQRSPMGAKMKARINRHLLNRTGNWDEQEDDKDWMRVCLRLKVEQHPDIRKKLISTGDKILVENCSNRDRESSRFWGAVYNSSSNCWEGHNILGNLWMELRDNLKQAG